MAILTELAGTILDRTREGKIEWAEFAAGGYYTNVGPNTITINSRPGPYSANFALRFTNEKGTTIETITNQDFEGLNELYELARRQALRVDETLSNIKRALDSL